MFQRLKDYLETRRTKKWLRQRKKLDYVNTQISAVQWENSQFRQIATQRARESAGHCDPTRSVRLAGDSTLIRHNSELLAQLGREKRELEKQLGIAVS